ncbi:hypothetical protein Rs2_48832 [Raphanus sativus]|nr:hypothetical protein Rs2_48832 [Raphanus sativus]
MYQHNQSRIREKKLLKAIQSLQWTSEFQILLGRQEKCPILLALNRNSETQPHRRTLYREVLLQHTEDIKSLHKFNNQNKNEAISKWLPCFFSLTLFCPTGCTSVFDISLSLESSNKY